MLGVAQREKLAALDSEARALLDTLAEQTAAALERGVACPRHGGGAERRRDRARAQHAAGLDLPRLPDAARLDPGIGDERDRLRRQARRGGANDLLGQIKQEAENLDEMVRNLLAITRIDAGGWSCGWDWIDLREIVDRVVMPARRRGARRKSRASCLRDLPLVRADASLVEQAIGNVVGNAIAHTPKETQVVIDADVTPEGIAVRITDDGPGIAADVLPRVFEKFVHARRSAGHSEAAKASALVLPLRRGSWKPMVDRSPLVARSAAAAGLASR